MADTMIAWTRQVPQVWDELQSTGRYRVKEEYVRAKNMEISDYYLKLYRWLTNGCKSCVSAMPQDADLPIWLAMTEDQRLGAAPDTISLTLEVPKDALFLVDYDKWGYIVNHWYVPRDEADDDRHNAELKSMGIVNEAALITTDKGNFYPQMKSKIIRSWQRLFEPMPADVNLSDYVGVIWEIKPEWVKEVEFYDHC